MKLILASGSPRRSQMLHDLRLSFEVIVPNVDETRLRGEPAVHYVERLAEKKAAAIDTSTFETENWAVLAADTIVVLQKTILGKPKNEADAVRMLTKLSGRAHEVITGYCWSICNAGNKRLVKNAVRTKVSFADRPKAFWQWYASTGEPLDKAGAYAAQGIGMSFIEKVSGSYSNVVGLPLSHVLATFKTHFKEDLRERCSKSC